jgi:ribokinase
VQVEASFEQEPTRRAVTLVDDAHERTITTFGRRIEPLAALVSSSLEQIDGVYFTAGDAVALASARATTRVLVASPRARHAVGHGVELDALVLSAGDAIERSEAGRADGEARLEVWTEGTKGGSFWTRDGESGRWAAAQRPGEPRDSYGCGDSFAAGLTFGLAAGMDVHAALALAAHCGAACATGRGPYEHQLTAADL